ncbi:MAG: hypothetical protein MUF49_15060 [Oculatellaceae cyanobacterium Prado106]|jgi:hypothetical protein|nr:hypothetical protein [Oculatellaceae cyanobacterium Prado106]
MTSQPHLYPDPSSPPSPIPPHSPEAIAQMVKLLDEWMEDDSGYDEETWPNLKAALNLERDEVRDFINPQIPKCPDVVR